MTLESRKPVFAVLGFLICANVLTWILVFKISKSKILEVCFFDIGQGDAIFITSPQQHQILIDGGPGSKILEKLSQEMDFYDRSLDLVILTHPEKDHMEGLIEVFKNYQVDYVLWTGILRDTIEFEEWQRVLEQEGAQIKIVKKGKRIVAGKAIFNILHPFENLEGKKFKDSNNTSIVARLSFENNSFLFTGDIYQSKEKEIIRESPAFLNSDVLKIAHHGSKTSTNNEFLGKVSPEIAVIQASKNNPYGHPHQEVLSLLQQHDVKILTTGELGDIKIISNGNILEIMHNNTL